DFSVHALKDKNLTQDDLDKAIETVRKGKVIEDKSNQSKRTVAFRLYIGKKNITYTVIVGLHQNFLRVVTIWKEPGKK
ncbi:MAG: DUF4258 domain-containing protein, partial [Desulfobacterales bacterium]|nr:DUF4258 domain-containing protein [Desulfobacterales bacterium]